MSEGPLKHRAYHGKMLTWQGFAKRKASIQTRRGVSTLFGRRNNTPAISSVQERQEQRCGGGNGKRQRERAQTATNQSTQAE